MKQKRCVNLSGMNPETIRTIVIFSVMIVLFVVQLIKSPTITMSPATFFNYVKKNIMAVVSIGYIAAGVTLSAMTGNIDLSTGKILTLGAIVSCTITQKYYDSLGPGVSALLAFLIPLVIGLICGMLNGLLVGRLQLNAFVVTFSTAYVFEAVAVMYNGGRTINAKSNPFYTWFGSGTVLGVPVPIIVLIAVYLFFAFILAKTVFGKQIVAVGGNKATARLSGINPNRIILIVYMLTGVLSALAGIFIGSWTQTADMLIGTNKEFNAITAVVLGGTLLSGGVGKISGTFVGILFLGVLDMFYVQFGIPDMWQWIIKGAILIVMLYVNGIIERSKSRRKSA